MRNIKRYFYMCQGAWKGGDFHFYRIWIFNINISKFYIKKKAKKCECGLKHKLEIERISKKAFIYKSVKNNLTKKINWKYLLKI